MILPIGFRNVFNFGDFWAGVVGEGRQGVLLLYREPLPCVEINGLCIAPLRIRFESGFPVFVPEPWSAK